MSLDLKFDLDGEDVWRAEDGVAKSEKVYAIPNTSYTLRLNPYVASSEKAMEVMGRICSAFPSNNIKKWTDELNDILFSKLKQDDGLERSTQRNIEDYFYDKRSFFHNKDFIYKLRESLNSLILGMDRLMSRPSPKAVLVSVGGTFNAGKSTFLNRIVEKEDLLPVDTIPTTMVPAFLYCGNFPDDVSVAGVNMLNAIVPLDKDILNCVSHISVGGESTAHQIATTLQHFIVQLCNDNFKDFVFIDTPGYGNTEDKTSRLNTDDMLADRYLSMGDIVLWLAPTKDGGLTADNISRLRKFSGSCTSGIPNRPNTNEVPKKIVILLTKADLVNKDKRLEIFQETCRSVEDMPNVVDVAMLSAADWQKWDEVWHSRSGYDFNTILRKSAKQIPLHHETRQCIHDILTLFDKEIQNIIFESEEARTAQRTAQIRYTEALKKIQAVEIRRKQFDKSNPCLNTDIRSLINKQFTYELGVLQDEYKKSQSTEIEVDRYLEELNTHYDFIRRWKLQFVDWLRAQSILEYSEKEEIEALSSENEESIKVYFILSRKIKNVNAYIHFWNKDGDLTSWPGVPMTFFERTKLNNIWTFNLPKRAQGIVFAVVKNDVCSVDDCSDIVHSQSVDFVDDMIKDGYAYYRTKAAGFYSNHKKTRFKSKMSDSSQNSTFKKPDKKPDLSDAFSAIKNQKYERLLSCFTSKCNITNSFNDKGMSLVTSASHYGFQKAIELFVRFCGTDVLNISDKRGYNALHSAAANLNFETCSYILRLSPSLEKVLTSDGESYEELIPIQYQKLLKI